MDWVLIICTSGWVMCGQERQYTYPSEASCYRALAEVYKRQRRDQFKYVVCTPKKQPANG